MVTHISLAVIFNDGVKGTIKICQSFCTGVFKPLLDDSVITKAKIGFTFKPAQ